MNSDDNILQLLLDDTFITFDRVLADLRMELKSQEIGIVQSVGHGIARVSGLPGVQSEEVVLFEGDGSGMGLQPSIPTRWALFCSTKAIA